MELNEKDLENVLGGANPRAVDAKLEEGYTKTFRDKVLEAKLGIKDELNEKDLENVLGGANPMAVDAKLEEGYTKPFRDKVLEAKLGTNKEQPKEYSYDTDPFNKRMTFEELQKYLNESDDEEKTRRR